MVESAVRQIEELGRESLVCPCDVTDRSSLEALSAAVEQRFGTVEILLNCAGINQRVPFLDMGEAAWKQMFEINAHGAMRACQVFGRGMVERGYGRIVNIGSLACFVGLHEVAAYAASKSALAGLTRALAVEWARFGVCVNAIVPGVFRTDINAALLDGTSRGQEFLLRTPMKRYGKLEELAGAAVFLASDAARFVTGHFLTVDGGILASGVNQ